MKYTTVSIPKPLHDKVKKFIKNTGFASTSAFVIFVLRELLIQNERNERPLVAGEAEIKEHLKHLGYM